MFKAPRYSLRHLLAEAVLLALALGFFRILVTGPLTQQRVFCVFLMLGCGGAMIGGWFHEFAAGALFGVVLACFLSFNMMLPTH